MTPVLIIGIDGLQPSQVTPDLMPNLSALAAQGVTFTNHHSVFPTVTRVNSASMMTGRHPGGHGLAGNTLLVRDYDPHRVIEAFRPDLSRVIEATGSVLSCADAAGAARESGLEFVSVNSGGNGNAFVQNPHPDGGGGTTIHSEFTIPDGMGAQVEARFGAWPEKRRPDLARITYAMGILRSLVFSDSPPGVMFFWSSEPDSSQHDAGVGSDKAVRALRHVDAELGSLFEELQRTGQDADTNVIVVSDHGYSTVSETVPVESVLREAGFPTVERPGGVAVAANGGAVLFYAHNRERETADRLAAWLMSQPWCGPVVASEAVGPIEGALPAGVVGSEGPRAPDLAVSLSWTSEENEAGVPGHAYCAGAAPGLGMHGSMSVHEMRCTLIAAGPGFRRAMVSDLPSGNVDVAPTVLRLLGLETPPSSEGRVLTEAMSGGVQVASQSSETREHTAARTLPCGGYSQRISVSRVGKTAYVNYGATPARET